MHEQQPVVEEPRRVDPRKARTDCEAHTDCMVVPTRNCAAPPDVVSIHRSDHQAVRRFLGVDRGACKQVEMPVAFCNHGTCDQRYTRALLDSSAFLRSCSDASDCRATATDACASNFVAVNRLGDQRWREFVAWDSRDHMLDCPEGPLPPKVDCVENTCRLQP
jgi:hypothetical protein